MSKVEWKQYKESEDYTVKKPKFTDQKGKKREYWLLDGVRTELISTMR